MKIINKGRFITTIMEIIIILLTIIITPLAIKYANSLRGYTAMGGEYLLPILSAIILMVIETIYEDKK